MKLSFLALLLAREAHGWGYCNDLDTSCANWAKDGECASGDHVKKLCPYSCGTCFSTCRDLEESCLGWADAGMCDSNIDYMHRNCPVSCGVCKTKCYDKSGECGVWARGGQCTKNPSLLTVCPVSCGVCTELCLDKKGDCNAWAAEGQCGTNTAYMLKNCPKACEVCSADTHAKSAHPVVTSKHSNDSTETVACADTDVEQCMIWGEDECEANAGAVMRACPKMCGACTLACEDKYTTCSAWAKDRTCDGKDAAFMKENCPESCNICRALDPTKKPLKQEL